MSFKPDAKPEAPIMHISFTKSGRLSSMIIPSAQRFSFQNRTDLSVPQEMKAASDGECSIQRGAPIWLEGHFATLSAVKASQITICHNSE